MEVILLAKNTGMNSDMIERCYGQVKLERMAKSSGRSGAAVTRLDRLAFG